MRILSYFAFLLLLLLSSSCASTKASLIENGTEAFYQSNLAPFFHGVASGDPLHDKVIIWTRVTPPHHQTVLVDWEVAEDENFTSIIAYGVSDTDSLSDYTIKVDATGLKANSTYFYRFKALGAMSDVGRTKTTNNTDETDIKLGIVSCSNYEFGYFSAYRHLGDKQLDAVIHLGDYFYEYEPGRYGDSTFTRKNLPPREIVSLSDYRTRYAQYRLDKDLQYIHRQHPFITIWDDHEITNDSYKTGAKNHQATEGDYEIRKQVAKQAYYEWLPIRPNESDVLYRKFDFGKLAEVIVLDERLEGRSEHAASVEEVDETKTMLGSQQLQWFKKNLSESDALWKIIGNQVVFSELDLSVVRPQSPTNLDAWDGYAVERDNIIEHIRNENIENVVFVTGDTHVSWAFEVPVSIADYTAVNRAVAVEFGTPSITSANWNERTSDEQVIGGETLMQFSNPHLKFINAREHGYMVLTLSAEKGTADWYYMDNIKDQKSPEKLAKTIFVNRDQTNLIEN